MPKGVLYSLHPIFFKFFPFYEYMPLNIIKKQELQLYGGPLTGSFVPSLQL